MFKIIFRSTLNIIMLLILFMILMGCQRADDTIFIAPEGYVGYIVIIYNQTAGADKEYRDGSRVYRIPSTGILLTQFPPNVGWSYLPKFYYNDISPENQIKFADRKNLPSGTVVATGGSVGEAYKDAGKEGIRYTKYYIGTKSQINEAYRQGEKLDIIELAE